MFWIRFNGLNEDFFFCKDPKEEIRNLRIGCCSFPRAATVSLLFKDFSEALLVVYCARRILLSNQYVILHKSPKSRGDI